MRPIAILDKSATKEICTINEILYSHLHSFSYGVNMEINIGIGNNREKLKIGDKYTIIFLDKKSVVFTLSNKGTIELNTNEFITVYRFVPPIFYNLIYNKIPNTQDLLGVQFKRYITSKNNQVKYFIFGLRKKALMLISDKETLHPKEVNIVTQINNPLSEHGEIYNYSEISQKDLKAYSYYTHKDGKISKTKEGIGQPVYLPQDDELAISALDNYILPKYELKMESSLLEVGDKILIGKVPHLIIEKDVFHYNKTPTTFLVAGTHSKAKND